MTNNNQLPRPTRSTMVNKRLNKAINAMNGHYPQDNGLRIAGRRSALPRARRRDLTAAVTGAMIILSLLVALLVLIG